MAELGQIFPVLGKYTYMDLSFVPHRTRKKLIAKAPKTQQSNDLFSRLQNLRDTGILLPLYRCHLPAILYLVLNKSPLNMSPIPVASPGSASKDYKRESTVARLLGSGMSLIGEDLILSDTLQDLPVLLSSLFSIPYDIGLPSDKDSADPLKVDTIAKRLMSNHGKVLS